MDIIGIITLNGYYNYGNRLQNYALQKAIEMMGFKCETIINTTLDNTRFNGSKRKKIKLFMKKNLHQKLNCLYVRLNKKKIHNLDKIRIKKFQDFTKENINETKFTVSNNNIPKNLANRYRYIIAGSDQVWNPNDPSVSQINFLTFAPQEKRIAYAPSFGVSEIQDEYKNKYKKWLSEMSSISVREEAGARIVKDLIRREVQVLIDPTMLLVKEQWISISKVANDKPKNKYILTYFLGDISKRYRKKIKRIAKENNLQIVNLTNIRDEKYYTADPGEFIDYINSANLLITDSFHGCVFGLLLQVPLIICKRIDEAGYESMNSRIDTFVNKFNLNSRRFDDIDNNKVFEVDYNESNNILADERKKAWSYLKTALQTK